MKRLIATVLLVTAAGFMVVRIPGYAQDPASKASLDHFMELKLEHSKSILEGLATEDYQMIATGAQRLTALSLESVWNVHTTQRYLDQSADFRRALLVISEAAHEENLDRAALGYVNMTVQCMECHRYLRKQGTTK
jgi:hypothetical protein